VAPGHNRVVPLEPEFIVPQDGHDKQDCETLAARRWLAAHGPQYARLEPFILAMTSMPANQFVRPCKGEWTLPVCLQPSSHPTPQEYLTGVELSALTKQVKHGRHIGFVMGPLRDRTDALAADWLMIEIRNAAGEITHRNSFITDVPVSRETVIDLAASGRARWKIENDENPP
jgi:hypothetical protein